MPRYDYKCKTCDHEFQETHSFAEHRPTAICPMCSGKSDQIYISPPIHTIRGLPKNRF